MQSCNYVELANNTLNSFKYQNLEDFSDEYGERFHQYIKSTENRYEGRWDTHMMTDFCWNLNTDSYYKK